MREHVNQMQCRRDSGVLTSTVISCSYLFLCRQGNLLFYKLRLIVCNSDFSSRSPTAWLATLAVHCHDHKGYVNLQRGHTWLSPVMETVDLCLWDRIRKNDEKGNRGRDPKDSRTRKGELE